MTASFTILDATRVLGFLLAQVLIALSNVILIRRLGGFPQCPRPPRVSVLVPARNEERDIESCVKSLLVQDYPDFEVIVYDDDSEDRTPAILSGMASERLRVITGTGRPPEWQGKAWACDQLAQAASGDILLFTDADTVHRPAALRCAVNALEAERLDLVTAIIGNRAETFGEQLTVPFAPWSMITLLPQVVSRAMPRLNAFTTANGQFILIRREAYRAIGGYGAVKNHATEDIALAKLARSRGCRVRLFDAVSLVTSRMYRGFAEARAGFSKNYFALFNYRLLVATFVWVWLMAITWYPLVVLISALVRGAPGPEFGTALLAVAAECLLWLIAARKCGFPLHVSLFYPAIITVSSVIGVQSIILAFRGKAMWKGRRLNGPRPRLI